MIMNAIEAVTWMLGAAAISYPLSAVILSRGHNTSQDHKGGNR